MSRLRSFALILFSDLIVLAAVPHILEAKYHGADPPPCATCSACLSCQNQLSSSNDSGVSMTEGNADESYPVTNLSSSNGRTVSLSLMYNSYNADGSRSADDIGLGYGWTHSFTD